MHCMNACMYYVYIYLQVYSGYVIYCVAGMHVILADTKNPLLYCLWKE
jgi:hypothetical protein